MRDAYLVAAANKCLPSLVSPSCQALSEYRIFSFYKFSNARLLVPVNALFGDVVFKMFFPEERGVEHGVLV